MSRSLLDLVGAWGTSNIAYGVWHWVEYISITVQLD